jgi:hypothetical protein
MIFFFSLPSPIKNSAARGVAGHPSCCYFAVWRGTRGSSWEIIPLAIYSSALEYIGTSRSAYKTCLRDYEEDYCWRAIHTLAISL